MPLRAEARAAWLIGLACALYVVVAWSVKPGFYDCCAAPQYDYVSPPPLLAAGNIQPSSGSGELQVRADGTVSGGQVATTDQPMPQANLFIVGGTLVAPASGGPVVVHVTPYAPPPQTDGVSLQGNVYCVTANTSFKPQQQGLLALSVPPYGPLATTIYFSPARDGPWKAIGGRFDLNTYQTTAPISSFGCFAVGYANPNPGSAPRIGGSLLPAVAAGLIVIVLLAGIPLAVRRRHRRGEESDEG